MVLGGFILCIIAIFLPPLPVILRRGCGADLLINILLCLLAWLPGILHAWYIILKGKEKRRTREYRNSPADHGHHAHDGHHAYHAQHAHSAPPPTAQQGYYPTQSNGYAPMRKY